MSIEQTRMDKKRIDQSREEQQSKESILKLI
jgi:hypothetical protein